VNVPYVLRYMRLEDVPQVVEIDKLSFTMPWSARSYHFELNDNNSAHMVTLETAGQAKSQPGLWGALRRLGKQQPAGIIVGYGGMWYIEGESHISTIATHPEFRGKGLGEVLLAGMLARSIVLGAEYTVLEVRVSNMAAINLYKKYEFEVVGRRKKYYRDNNEDAFLMNLAPMNEAYRERLNERISALNARVPYLDRFTYEPVRR
jgi:[ribosomal protein S18]-alanine N-acetyltransferase